MEYKKTWIISVLLVVFVAASGWLLYRHYTAAGTNTGRSATDTVEQIKRNDKSAGHDIDNATDQIESAQSELDRAGTDVNNAQQSADRLQESVKSNQDTISECNDLVESGKTNIATERSIIADVDNANKTNGASR